MLLRLLLLTFVFAADAVGIKRGRTFVSDDPALPDAGGMELPDGAVLAQGPVVLDAGDVDVPGGPVLPAAGDGELVGGPVLPGEGDVELPDGPVLPDTGDVELPSGPASAAPCGPPLPQGPVVHVAPGASSSDAGSSCDPFETGKLLHPERRQIFRVPMYVRMPPPPMAVVPSCSSCSGMPCCPLCHRCDLCARRVELAECAEFSEFN